MWRTHPRAIQFVPRYALLRHTGAPDDPSGCHYDLLLEDGGSCRTWRLPRLPLHGGDDTLEATPLPDHRRIWLDHRSAAVSGGRGWAERVMAGTYSGVLPTGSQLPVLVVLIDGDLQGTLRIQDGTCSLSRT